MNYLHVNINFEELVFNDSAGFMKIANVSLPAVYKMYSHVGVPGGYSYL